MPVSISVPRAYRPLIEKFVPGRPEFVGILLLASSGTRQYYFAAMVGQLLAGETLSEKQLAGALLYEKRQQVLDTVWQRPTSDWLPILRKVGAAIHEPYFYKRLLEAHEELSKQKLLRHWRRLLTPMALEFLLPAECPTI